MRRVLILTLLLLVILSLNSMAMNLDNFSISAILYPRKLPDNFSNGWIFSDQEWLSFSINFTANLWQGLYFHSDTTTYIFATNGFKFAPSSTKFISEFGYKFDNIHIRYRHFCHHYFHQFTNHYNDSDKLILEYSF